VHYGIAIVPARSGKPRDKAKAEQGVLLAERWILARLRNHQFFSLAELNAQIRTLLEALNHRAFKKLSGSRRSHYEEIDRPALNVDGVGNPLIDDEHHEDRFSMRTGDRR
jgi:transposase